MEKNQIFRFTLKFLIYTIVFLASFFITDLIAQTSGQNRWFIDKNATGLNNGTNWSNAWSSFTSIIWTNIQAGDTLFISGGTDSSTYTERLVIDKKFGQPGKLITLTKGKEPGHNGKVIFDGNYLTGQILNISGSQFLKIEKITIKKSNIRVMRSSNPTTASRVIILDSIIVDEIGAKGGIEVSGYPTLGLTDSVFITNCRITNSQITSIESDLISIMYAKNTFLRNNYLYHHNNNANHCDGIQTQQQNENIEISGNYIQHIRPANPVSGFADNGVIIRGMNGVVKIFNNLIKFNTHVSWFNVIMHDYYNNPGQLHIYNNTFIGGESNTNVIYTNITDSLFVKNNIFYETRSVSTSNYPLFTIANTIPASNLNNNVFYNPNNYQYLYSYYGYNRTLAQLQSNGAELNSTYGQDPLFVDFNTGDYRIQSVSPAKDAGLDLSSFFTVDKNGFIRPQGNAWDIGAFEFSENQIIIDNDPPEVLSAQIVDSITVNIIFSEPLEQSSVSNSNNYSITNGITINHVQLVSDHVIRLNTSVHTTGLYSVTVSNVTDTANNIISTSNNSVIYGYYPDSLSALMKFIPTGSLASSIPEPQHLPEKTFDGLGYNGGDPSSRWAAQGLPQWIVYDLGDIKMINKTRIQFYRWLEGRIYTYSILVSLDSISWTTAKQNIQSLSVEWNEESFDPTIGRYVKILVTGNNENDWVNIWETEIYGHLMISDNEDNQSILPTEFRLLQNYPNPFNPTTKISWQSPVGSWQTLKVYDILGNEIATLVDEYRDAGAYQVEFNSDNLPNGRQGLASGVYIYRIQSEAFTETKKMILIR